MECDVVNIVAQITLFVLLYGTFFIFIVMFILDLLGIKITPNSQFSDEERKRTIANMNNNRKTLSQYEQELSKHWINERYGK